MAVSLKLRRVEAFCYRFPLPKPVITSFGRMVNRPAVFVRIEDEHGISGLGEVWCNFPSPAAEHRVRLVNEVLAPLVVEHPIEQPQDVYQRLFHETRVLILQSGESGPFAQAIAGLDIASWDLFARGRGEPLWRMLGGSSPHIRVYASGINPDGAEETAERAAAAGHRAFKLKIGFGDERDRANLTKVRRVIGQNLLAVDANQAWSIEEARRLAPTLEPFEISWLEEPVPADTNWSEWRRIAEATRIPLAAGENITSREHFSAAISANVLSIIQPDVAKWGGLTMCSHVAREALAAGRSFCPHYLGGGIGLLASAHLLAGMGGDGLLEIDVNPNPLRDECCGTVRNVDAGHVTLSDGPGLGIEADLSKFAAYRTA